MDKEIIKYKNYEYTLDCDDGICFKINELNDQFLC